MKSKKVIALLAVFVILVVGLVAVSYGYNNSQVSNIDVEVAGDAGAMGKVYNYYKDGILVAHTEVLVDGNCELVYDVDESELDADSVADIIVYKNVADRNAANDVASIVFDFRGYDTIGEALILSTAICGSFCILFKVAKKKEGQA